MSTNTQKYTKKMQTCKIGLKYFCFFNEYHTQYFLFDV